MFCTQCGQEARLGAMFCTQCGTPLRLSNSAIISNAAPALSAPIENAGDGKTAQALTESPETEDHLHRDYGQHERERPVDGQRHANCRTWLITATILAGLSLVVWYLLGLPITMMALGGLFTHPGARGFAGMDRLLFAAAVGYPLVVAVSLVGGWVEHARHHHRVAFWWSLLPLADVLVIVGGMVLLSWAITGHF